jgi:hypothetical protein
MSRTVPTFVAMALFATAIALHAYESFYLADSPAPGFFAWSLLPYLVCLAFYRPSKSLAPVIVGASVALAVDALVHYDVFIHPTRSTAALALLFVPLWSAFVFVPVSAFIAWLVVRRPNAARENAP